MNDSEIAVGHSSMYIWKWHGAEVIFLLLMLVLAIFGNTLVIYIYHFRWRRSNFSLFIEVLASLDITNASITIPLFLVITFNDTHDHFGPLCQASSFFAITNVMASSIVLVVIAVDRNRNISKPLETKISTPMAKKLCMAALFSGFLVAIPGVFVNGRREFEFQDNGIKINITQCFFTKEMDGTPLFWIFLVILGVVFLVVAVILIKLYCSIYHALEIHTARRPSTSIHQEKNKTFRSQKTSAKIFLAVTIAFFCGYSPYFIAAIVFLVNQNSAVMTPTVKAFADIAKLFPLLSNAINPLIYSVSSKRFRKEVINVIRCGAVTMTPSERTRASKHGTTSSTADDV